MFEWLEKKLYMFSGRTNQNATKNGIFIHSTKSYNVIINACKDLIQKSDGKIILETISEKYRGIEIYLNKDGLVQELLEKRFLLDETGNILFTMYPLTTQLIIHGEKLSIEEYDFVGKLMVIFHDALGPVLEICKIPSSEPQTAIWNCNWGVLLDVPDIEDMDDFKRVGLPDDFKIRVPGVHRILSVKFYCTICEKDGHTKWRCYESIHTKTKYVSESSHEEHLSIDSPFVASSLFSVSSHEKENKEGHIALNISPLMKRKNSREFKTEITQKNEPLIPDIVSPNSDKSRFYNSNSTTQRLLFSETDNSNIDLLSNEACVSPINYEGGQMDNSFETSNDTNKPLDQEKYPITFSSNSAEFNSASVMKRLLLSGEDSLNSESKKACISPINDDYVESDNTSKTNNTTEESIDRDIFQEFNSSKFNIDEFSSSNYDSAMKCYLSPEMDNPNKMSHSLTTCKPFMNDDRWQLNNKFEINSTINAPLNMDLFSKIFLSDRGESNYFDRDFERQKSLFPERDYPSSKSDSESTMNDKNGRRNDTPESSFITSKSIYPNTFSKLYSSKSGGSSYSNNDFKMDYSLLPERDDLISESLSQKASTSAMNDNQEHSESKSKTQSASNDVDCETIIVYDPGPSTSSQVSSQHVGRLSVSAADTFENLMSTSNQSVSTDDILFSGFPPSNQGVTVENYAQDNIYDDVPTRIYNIISEMKSNPLDINDLDNHSKKIRILSNIATTLNIMVTDLKMELQVIKRRYERNPESDNEFITKLESIIDKWDVSNTTNVIPEHIKEIILEMKTGALGIDELETFFKQTKKKKNLSNVIKSLNVDVDSLKKQLNEIKSLHDKNSERGNKEVNGFMKRLERIINRLDDHSQVNPKRIKEIISEIKNGAVNMNELEIFIKQAKDKKDPNNVSKLSNIDVGSLE